jgi:hypothetical protein
MVYVYTYKRNPFEIRTRVFCYWIGRNDLFVDTMHENQHNFMIPIKFHYFLNVVFQTLLQFNACILKYFKRILSSAG